MKCEEFRSLHGAYLDSELDARTTLEIQQHLTACPDCARSFAAEAKLEAQVATGLKRGERTAALWEQIEQRVAAAAAAESRRRPAIQVSLRMPWWRELLWPSPQAWACLAATWVVLLGVSFITRQTANGAEGRQMARPTQELRLVLKQQKQLLAELGGIPEQLAGKRPETSEPQPRSQRREQLSNT